MIGTFDRGVREDILCVSAFRLDVNANGDVDGLGGFSAGE